MHLSPGLYGTRGPLSHPSALLTMDLVDLRVLGQDVVGEPLGGGQHLGVVHGDQVLHQLLQLVAAHLQQRLGDGQVQPGLLRPPDALQRQRHHVGAVEDVAVAAAAGDRRDLAAVEADGHAVGRLGLRRRGRLPHRPAQVEPWEEEGGGRG